MAAASTSAPAASTRPESPAEVSGFVPPRTRPVNGHPQLVRKVEAAYEAAKKAPDDAAQVGELGMLYYVSTEPVAAATCLSRAAQLDPQSVRWKYYLGMAYEVSYEKEQAIRAYEGALAIDPKYAPILVNLAGLFKETDPNRAAMLYRRSVELNPNDVRAYLGLGQCAEKANDVGHAVEYYRLALRLCPDYAHAHQALGSLLASQGRKDEAQAHRNLFTRGGPPPLVNDPLLVELLGRTTNAPFLMRMAQRLVKACQYDDATAVLNRAIEIDETKKDARESLGVVLAMQGRFAEAVKQFEEILKIDPVHDSTRAYLAQAFVEMGRFQEADNLYKAVLDKNPKDTLTLRRYGAMLLIQGREEEAENVLDALVKLEPDNPENRLDLALCDACLRKYDESVAEYQRAKELMTGVEAAQTSYLDRFRQLFSRQKKFPPKQPDVRLMGPSEVTKLADRFRAKGLFSEFQAAERLVAELKKPPQTAIE